MATVADPPVIEASDLGVTSTAPPERTRLQAAVAIGLASAIFTAFAVSRRGTSPDFEFWWRGAQMLLAGGNPYRVTPGTPDWPLLDPLFYPLPTLLLTTPLAWLPLPIASAAFMGVSGGLLAWLVSRDGLWRLWIFGTASYFMACKVGQWSPLLISAAFLPAAGFLAAMKPNLGLALLVYRPTWRAMLGCAAIGLLSFAVLPSWLVDWHANTAFLVGHPPPILTHVGPILLLALLRWRRPETRLLLAMACVPQLLFFADQLPLFLIPKTRREMKVLVLCTAFAFFVWYFRWASDPAYVLAAAPYALWSTYLPCLIMILRKSNVGDVPEWVERLVTRVAQIPRRRTDTVRSASAPTVCA